MGSWATFPAKGIVMACEAFLGKQGANDYSFGAPKGEVAIRRLLLLSRAAESAHRDVNVSAEDFELTAEFRG